MRRVLAAAALLVAITSAPADGEFTMACMSQNEWDRVDVGLTVAQVRTIADGPGNDGPTKPGQYSLQWPTCWRDDKLARVWFSNVSDLSVDKNVVDK